MHYIFITPKEDEELNTLKNSKKHPSEKDLVASLELTKKKTESEDVKAAVKYALHHKHPVDKEFILGIHERLFTKREKYPGAFREDDITVKGYETSSHSIIDEEIDKLLDWYAERKETGHPFELAVLFHIRLLKIFPFMHGNGRVAEIVMDKMLKDAKYPMHVVSDRKKYEKEFAKALSDYDEEEFFWYVYKEYVKENKINH